MTTEVVIVHADRTDVAAVEALELLGSLVGPGIIKPFWQIDSGTTSGAHVPATEWSADGPSEVELLTALSDVRDISRIRLATLASAALPAAGVLALARVASDIAAVLTAAQPAGVPFSETRIAIPLDIQTQTHLTDLFSPLAAANIVVIPEDRVSDAGFAVPMSTADPSTYAAHAAVELATQVGLWSDMHEAPSDALEPGVMAGDIRVWFVRSFARVAIAPPLPVDRAIAASDVLPVPPGIEPAPIPHQTAANFAEHLFGKFDELHFQEPAPYAPRRKRLSIGAAVRLLGSEARTYVVNLPYQLRHGALADLSYTAGEALSSALGESSTIEVVWQGKVADHESPLPDLDIDALRWSLVQRLGQPESASFDQSIWSSLVDDILAMVDGGPTSEGTEPPSIGSERVAVVAPQAVAPKPDNGIRGVVEALNAEPLHSPQSTALGQMSACIRNEIGRSDSFVHGVLEAISAQLQSIQSRGYGFATLLSWLSGLLVAGLIAGLLVHTGLARAFGIDTWGFDTRVRLAQIGFVLIVAILAALLAAGLRGTPALQGAFITCVIVLIFGASIALRNWQVEWRLVAPVGTIRVGEFLLVATVVVLIAMVLIFCLRQPTVRGATAARVTGVVAVVFAAAIAVVATVRPDSWYASASNSELRSAGIRWFTTLAICLIVVLILLLVLRIRERLTVEDLRSRLRWGSDAAERAVAERARLSQSLRQWHGTATAIARIIWEPFGKVRDGAGQSVDDVGIDGDLRKLQIYVRDPREEELFGVMSRIRHEVADPGWLLRQYRVAVEAFQPQYSFRTGRPVVPGDLRRPETDPAPEDPALGAGTPGTGIRWTFAEMLADGAFDNQLRAVGGEVAVDAVLEMYFARPTADDSVDADLSSFAGDLVQGTSASLPVHLFERSGIPVAGDERAQFSTTIWWPGGVARPSTNRTVSFSPLKVSADGSRGLVACFVRSDWSQPMPLAHVPFATSQADAISPARRANNRDADNDVM
ncbi:MAG: hypothetical protein ACI83Y_002342 [Candidatus Azotimanducaceae bacterium]